MPTEADVLIAGGGPAGAACALRLSRYGFRVLLFDKGEGKRQHVGESLPSSLRVVLETLGIELPPEVVVARPPLHLVYWGEMQGGEPWSGLSERERSLLVWRGPFDRLLRDSAAAAGARLLTDAVSEVKRRPRGGVEIRTVRGRSYRGRFFIDASGRSGVVARSYRRKEVGFRTLALTGHFRTAEAAPPTLIEAFENGWIWTAPLANGLRDVTVMLDAPGPGSDREALFFRSLSKAPHAERLVASLEVSRAVRGIDATPYDARRFCASDFLLAGDAASFLDPLAAHGVHKAMDGALVAAIVTRTILERPASAEAAAQFYDQRERSIVRAITERLQGLYRQERRFAMRPFWRRRAEGERSESRSEKRWGWGRSALMEDRELAPASRPPLDPRARLRGRAALCEAPVLEGDFVERREVLMAPGAERPVRFLGTVCLPDLYKDVLSAGSALAGAGRSPAGVDRALQAVDWLYRRGYLEPGESKEL
jgi:flavin-dependent dehydrogenase